MELIKRKLSKININQINFDIKIIYPYDFLEKNRIFPIRVDDYGITLAVSNLEDTKLLTKIREDKLGTTVTFFETPEFEILDALKKYIEIKNNELTNKVNSAFSSFESFESDLAVEGEAVGGLNLTEDIEDSINNPGVSTVTNGVNAILLNAVKLGASDIHIEPYETEVRVRYRVDGILITIKTFPIALMPAISSRMKILANLNISETRRSQDGRFRLRISKKDIDFRMSTLLLAAGEKIVLRILDKEANALDLNILGFDEESLVKIKGAVNSSYGLILVTGPTGSGKSTTLYSILGKLNKPDVNISTIEDPVEYNISGINQVQYNEEIENTFTNVLKSFLRQDPDVIVIGEIRDEDTASIAIKSSLTGHLVLSTLHTNNAVATINRLLDMGTDRSLLISAVSLIITQRLIRKICPHCAEEETEFEKKEKLIALKVDVEKYKDISFKHAKGCEKCNNLGYKGRSVIFEVLKLDSELKDAILNNEPQHRLVEIARKNGMATLNEVALQKAIDGVTSLDEIIRLL